MKPTSRKGSRPISPPDLPAHLPSPLLPLPAPQPGAIYTEFAVSDWDPSARSGASITFECMILERANLAKSAMRFLRLKDVRLLKCDLSNADWPSSAFERVEVLEGRLTGLKAAEATFQDVSFVACKADLAQFRYASFRDCRFEDCLLRDADFQGADLRGVSFRGSDVRGANFTGAKLDQADFRGVQLDEVILRPSDLKGVIIDAGQAVALSGFLAQALGMTVIDR